MLRGDPAERPTRRLGDASDLRVELRTQPAIPPAVVSTSAGDAMERAWRVPGAPGYTWSFLLREYGERSGAPPEFQVIVESGGGWVSLHAGRRAMLLFIGPPDALPLALAARDHAIAGWLA